MKNSQARSIPDCEHIVQRQPTPFSALAADEVATDEASKAGDLYRPAFLYVAITERFGGFSFLKIGITESIIVRIPTLQTGCPFRIESLLTLAVPSMGVARRLERRMHLEFRDRNTFGEWFKFDLSSDVDRIHFAKKSKVATEAVVGEGPEWESTDIPKPI